MIDSENTGALDNYGVWVKKSPKEISQEENNLEENKTDSFDITSDLPDFSNIENSAESSEGDFDSGETSLTSEELLNITGNIDSSAIENAPENSEDEGFIDVPEMTSTESGLPEMDVPEMNADTELSESAAPEIDIPETGAPEIDMPLTETDTSASDFDMPVMEEPVMENSEISESPVENETAFDVQESPAPADDTIAVDNGITDEAAQAETSPMDSMDDISDILKQNTPTDPEAPLVMSFDDTEDITDEPQMNEEISDNLDIPAENEEPAADFGGVEEEIISEEENSIENEPAQTEITQDIPESNSFEDNSIPDTFEEETSMFTDENEQENNAAPESVPMTETVAMPEPEVQSEPAGIAEKAQNDIISQSNAILLQIQKELSSLQSEITSLKNDFNKFKEVQNAAAEIPPQEEATGFFSDDDNDDTISLSGDELSNIMTNADSTEEITSEGETFAEDDSEPTEESAATDESLTEESVTDSIADDNFYSESEKSDSDFDINFNDEKLEEPNLDEIQLNEDESEEEETDIPSEMFVPKVEDVLVESSDSDNMVNMQEETPISETDDFAAEEIAEETVETPAIEETPVMEETPAEPESEELTLEEQSAPAGDSPFMDEVPAEEDSMFGDLSSAMGDESDSFAETPADTPAAETENTADAGLESDTESDVVPSAGLDDATIDDFYPQGNETEPELTQDNLDYLATDENKDVGNEAPAASASDLPGDLTKDIKAVLSYMDQLLENLPDEKIAEFAQSEQFITYKKLFTELGLA